ncbi:MAG: hypothetical protein KAY24_14775 [Candidatus Eisenbacteria sp.]|nr:hypothetical protein [Candidatus Eisenbacteria bacterium]
MGPRRKKGKTSGSRLLRLGPFFLTFLAGGVATLLLLWVGGVLRWDGKPDPGAANEPECLRAQANGLAAILLPQAEWHSRDTTLPMEWVGRLRSSESLIQWNARVSAGIQSLGMDVLEGREEILERVGQWPLQRLTLVVGSGGETLATVIVETSRSPNLPPPF